MLYEILDHTDEHLIAVIDSVALVVWKTRTNSRGIAQLNAAYPRASNQGKRKCASFGYIFKGCQLPPTPHREAIMDGFYNPTHQVGAIVAVLEGDSVYQSAARAIINGMTIFSRANVRAPCYKTTGEASAYLSAQIGSAPMLQASVNELVRLAHSKSTQMVG